MQSARADIERRRFPLLSPVTFDLRMWLHRRAALFTLNYDGRLWEVAIFCTDATGGIPWIIPDLRVIEVQPLSITGSLKRNLLSGSIKSA